MLYKDSDRVNKGWQFVDDSLSLFMRNLPWARTAEIEANGIGPGETRIKSILKTGDSADFDFCHKPIIDVKKADGEDTVSIERLQSKGLVSSGFASMVKQETVRKIQPFVILPYSTYIPTLICC